MESGWATALTRTIPLPNDLTVSATIGKRGGWLTIPAAGLRIYVPPGAVQTPTDFTATALAGDLVAYEFEPHGATFGVPLELTQDLTWTSWDLLADLAHTEGGYFRSRAQLDQANRRGFVDEFRPAYTDAVGKKLRFDVWHFSGYMVSSGRL